MKSISVRELEMHVREILRQVESGEAVEVVENGKILARVVPADRVHSDDDVSNFIAELDRMAAEIGKHLPERVDAVQAVREVRREL